MTRRAAAGVLCAGLLLAGLAIQASPAKAVVNCDTSWTAGDGDWQTAANWDNGVPTSSKDACVTGTTAKRITISGITAEVDVLTIQNPNGVLRVQHSCCADVVLQTSGGIDNAGTIELLGNAYLRKTVNGVSLTNTGTITNLADNNGSARSVFDLPVLNHGTITVGDNLDIGQAATITNNGTTIISDGADVELYAGSSFINNGTLNTNTTGEFRVRDQAFTQAGSVTGTKPVLVEGGTLTMTPSVVSTGAFLLNHAVQLTGNIDPGETITVAANCCVDGVLVATASFTNAGTIVMGSEAYLRKAQNGITLTNTGAITIRSDNNTSNRSVFDLPILNNGAITVGDNLDIGQAAVITNNGTTTISDGADLELYAGSSFINNGTLNTNTTGEFRVRDQAFTQGAGTITGTKPVLIDGGTLTFTPGAIGTGAFRVNNTVTLTGDIDPGETITVESTCCTAGFLVAAASFTNAGTIAMGSEAYLRKAQNGIALTNTGAITILADNNPSNRSVFDLPIRNDGTLTVNDNLDVGNASLITNNGTTTIGDGADLELYAGSSFINNGTLNTNTTGEFRVRDQAFTQGAGTITGTKPVLIDGGTLTFTPGAIGTGAFRVNNTVTLTGNIDPGETITVEDTCCTAGILTTSNSYTNAGTINLRGNSHLRKTVNGVTLTNTGTIRVPDGGSGIGRVELPLLNNGVIEGGRDTGLMHLNDTTTLTSSSVWNERITTFSRFDRVAVNGTLALGGELAVSEQPSAEPAPNTTLQIASGGTISGAFAHVSQFVWASGFGWAPTYGVNTVNVVFQDLVAPTAVAPTVTSPITHANRSAVSVAGACTTGDKVNVRVRDASPTTPDLSVTGTCVAGAFDLSVDTTDLADGTLTFGVTMARAGAVSALPAATATKDSTPPTGPAAPTVSLPDITGATAAAVPVTGTCEAGAALAFTFVSTGGATTLTETGTCSGTGEISESFDLDDLADGTVTVTVTQTRAGLESDPGTDTATMDTTAPAAPGVTFETDPVNAATAAAVVISGTCETGATVTVMLSGPTAPPVNDTDTCADSDYKVTLDGADFGEGDLTASATQADTFGNASSATTKTVLKDAIAPAAPTVTITTNPINDTNQEAVAISGTCETGAEVTVTVTDSVTGSLTATKTCATGAYSDTVDVSDLADGTITATPKQTDTAGNQSANGTADTAQKSTAPTEVPGSIDITPAFINSFNVASVAYTGTCVTGNKVDVSFTDSGGFAMRLPQFTCAASGTFGDTINAEFLDEGNVVAAAVQTDTVAHPAHTETVLKDTVAPAGSDGSLITPPSINSTADVAAVPYSGTCVAGNEVRLTVSDQHDNRFTTPFPCPGGGTFSRTFDARGMTEGDYLSVTTIQVDPAGNIGAGAGQTVLKDTTAPAAPTITITTDPINATNQAAVSLGGTCETGATVAVVLSDSATGSTSAGGACTAGTYTATADVSALANGTITATAKQYDEAGNVSRDATDTAQKSPGGPVHPAGSINITPATITAANKSAVPYTGTCVAGNTLEVSFWDPSDQNIFVPPFTCPANGTFARTVDLTRSSRGPAFIDGKIEAFALQIDTTRDHPHHYDSAQMDSTGPTDAEGSLEITPLFVNQANVGAVPYTGTCRPGNALELKAFDKDRVHVVNVRKFTCAASGTFSGTFKATTLNQGIVGLKAVQRDALGNRGFTELDLAQKDTVAPKVAEPKLSQSPVLSDGSEDAVKVRGSCEKGSVIRVAIDDTDPVTASLVHTVACVTNTLKYESPFDLRSLAPTKLLIAISIIDVAENTATATFDATKKSNLDVTFGAAFANSANQANVPYTLSCSTGMRFEVTAYVASEPSRVFQIKAPSPCPASYSFKGTLTAQGIGEGETMVIKVNESTPQGRRLGSSVDEVVKDTRAAAPTAKLSPMTTDVQAKTVHVTGTCEPGGTVTVRITKPESRALTPGTCKSSGTYDVTFSATSYGKGAVIEVQVFQVDRAGNKSATATTKGTKTI